MALLLVLAHGHLLWGERQEIKRPEFGNYIALWRVTNDPIIEDQAGYHTQQVWSPDGRYLVYTHRAVVPAPDVNQPHAGRYEPMVHVYDFFKNEDRALGRGIMQTAGPCWANRHNWVFFVQYPEGGAGFAGTEGFPVMWADMGTGKITKIGDGMDQLGGVDCKDEWVFGGIKDTSRKPAFRAARVRADCGNPTSAKGGVEELPEVTGWQFIPNPEHPLFFTRHDHYLDEPFSAAIWWWDLAGKNRRMGAFGLDTSHKTWQGNGEHVLLGDGLARGRRWDEPAPSNVHILSAYGGGNISACGRSGRFLVGDATLFDTRSGDAREYKYFMPPRLKPSSGPYPSFDGEAKGSPDGTKVSFTEHYDLESGPVTELTQILRADDSTIQVKSTAGFPPLGAVVIWCEVIGYERKTAVSFEGLTRGLHGTYKVTRGVGDAVTDFRFHLMTEEQWKALPALGNEWRIEIKDLNNPLMRQRRTDVWITVVRRPDRPWLQREGEAAQIVPGESHYETYGYHITCDGKKITEKPLRPGKEMRLEKAGSYCAIAVEWSGLQGEPSKPVSIAKATRLQALRDCPWGFSWTRERWVKESGKSVKEIVHLYDGVIAREWHEKGVITQHHDLNAEGKAIRRLTFKNGKLAERNYHDREDRLVSREVFAPDGFVTEQIWYGGTGGTNVFEMDHWWYDKGTPARRVTSAGRFVKQGEQWAKE